MSKRMTFGLAAMAFLASGCGPHPSMDATTRSFSTDVRYGAPPPTTTPRPPAPHRNLAPAFPGFIVPPPPPPAPVVTVALPPTLAPPPAVPSPCPPASVFAVPAIQADSTVAGPPRPGVYRFRQAGSNKVGDAPASPVKGDQNRTVSNVVPGTGGQFSYDVSIVDTSGVTTTTYQVQRSLDRPELDGLYLTHVQTTHPDGSVDEFSPVVGARIISLPAQPGGTWDSVATDPLTGTSIVLSGTIAAKKARVDACGTILDAWQVDVTGHLLGTGRTLNLKATYDVGTQFGALVLSDHVALDGTDQNTQITQDVTSIVSSATPSPLSSPAPSAVAH